MQSVSRAGASGLETRWTDSTIKGRDEILGELGELAGNRGCPKLVVLEGPRGVGTSTLAKELVDQVKRTWRGIAREDPVVVHVDVSSLNHAKGDPSRGVATAILQRFNQGVQVQGSSSGRVVWWALRRIAAQPNPVIVWLDQVHEDTRTLAGVLEPLMEPGRVLETGALLPPILVVVSGTGKTDLGSWPECVPAKWIHVPLLPRSVLEEVVAERALELGCEISPGAVTKVLNIMVTKGRGLSIMGEILQASAANAGRTQGGTISERDVPTPRISVRGKTSRQALEVLVLEIVRKAGGQLTMGELVEQLTQDLTRAGEAHRTGSTLRRLTARLEQLGLVERRVTLGGEGGTRSTLSLPGHPSLR
jgi:hypothetical protein